MPAGKMHADEVDTDVALVRRLLAAQFSQWADLPIQPVPSAGTDNTLYRLGDDLVVRLPRIQRATGQVDKEHRGFPDLPRTCRLPSLPRSRRGHPAKATSSTGPSTGGSRARTRPSSASPTHARRRRNWQPSSLPCSGSIPRAGRSLWTTTCAAFPWPCETPTLGRLSQPCTA